ncbi:MAG TPA: hypothetical protein VD883_01760 [Candidatus Omnitrophota bacterium]|nr:hypothetical protein [Candidatus Omnitrophota bacterium]
MRSHTKFRGAALFSLLLLAVLFVQGCAPLLIAGGAVGGYAVAKDMDDGKLIDSKK